MNLLLAIVLFAIALPFVLILLPLIIADQRRRRKLQSFDDAWAQELRQRRQFK